MQQRAIRAVEPGHCHRIHWDPYRFDGYGVELQRYCAGDRYFDIRSDNISFFGPAATRSD